MMTGLNGTNLWLAHKAETGMAWCKSDARRHPLWCDHRLAQRQAGIGQHAARDDESHHLVGALQNAVYPGIAQIALERILRI